MNAFVQSKLGRGLLFIAVIFCFLAAAWRPVGATDKTVSAVHAVRIINTAESWYHGAKGHYVDLGGLLESGEIARAEERFVNHANGISFTPGSNVVPGFNLRLIVAPGGATYSVSIVPADENTCATSVFSDERGLIYTGRVLDCR